MPPSTPLQSLHTPGRASLQLTSPQVDNRESQRDVESCESRNVNNQQQDSATPDTLHSEQLPVATDQQSRCFTQDQTSIAHDEGRTPLNIQNSNEPVEKGGC